MNHLLFSNVSKKYSQFELKPFDLLLDNGDIVGLVGVNGAGKTTLLNLLADRIQPTTGEVYYKNQKAHQMNQKKNLFLAYYDGICPFYDRLTPKDICTIMYNWYPNWDIQKYNSYLDHFTVFNTEVKKMSYGTKKKLMLAVMLAKNPEILICDEMTSGLDPIARRNVLTLIKEYICRTNSALLFSTHIIGDLEDIANRIILIDHGEVILHSNLENIIVDKPKHTLEDVLINQLELDIEKYR